MVLRECKVQNLGKSRRGSATFWSYFDRRTRQNRLNSCVSAKSGSLRSDIIKSICLILGKTWASFPLITVRLIVLLAFLYSDGESGNNWGCSRGFAERLMPRFRRLRLCSQRAEARWKTGALSGGILPSSSLDPCSAWLRHLISRATPLRMSLQKCGRKIEWENLKCTRIYDSRSWTRLTTPSPHLPQGSALHSKCNLSKRRHWDPGGEVALMCTSVERWWHKLIL